MDPPHPAPSCGHCCRQRLVFCWRTGDGWLFRCALAAGACPDGLPHQTEAIAELIADLLFDLELLGAELVLCLLLNVLACH